MIPLTHFGHFKYTTLGLLSLYPLTHIALDLPETEMAIMIKVQEHFKGLENLLAENQYFSNEEVYRATEASIKQAFIAGDLAKLRELF